jgi:class 3 adenylate cyclase
MYERLGDAQAFALVKEHFYIMERLVRQHNGAILDTAKKLKNAIIVKVGIHHGPCIAVTLNERIDYFGTTVNIAARVKGLSDGRDVMASGGPRLPRAEGGLGCLRLRARGACAPGSWTSGP